jgi:hypothetical protein
MKKLTTMRKALSDPQLLADALPGRSWSAWRVLLIAAMGESLNASERKVFQALTGRKHEPGRMVETLLVVAGRRSGKTKAMAVLSTYLSCLCDWSEDLSLGERGLALYLAPSERQANVAHDYAADLVDHVELLRSQVASRTASSITLHSGLCLEVQAANWRYSRGATAICITFDECAFLYTSDDAVNSDVELMTALRPSLATTGGPMLLTSSPSAMEGIVYALWKRHYGAQGDKRILVVQADSRALNPKLRKSVVDRAYEHDAVGADAEYGGRFRQPVSAYLERSVVEKCVEVGVTQRQKIPMTTHLAFADPAGGSGGDSFTCAIGHKTRLHGQDVCVVDALFEARSPFDPDAVTAQCAQLLLSYSVLVVMGDSYASQWPVTAFARNGITYQAAPVNKGEIYQHALPLWTAGRVLMLDNPRAVDQLCGLKRKLGQGGREIIDHPRGAHDDLANSISGLLWRLTPVQQRVSMNALPVIVTTSRRGCFGDNPRGTSASEYAAYTGAGETTRNPAFGLPRDGRDSWERW